MTDYELMKRYMAIKGCILDLYESLANARTKKERSGIAELAHELGDVCAYYSGEVMKNITRDERHKMVRKMTQEFLEEFDTGISNDEVPQIEKVHSASYDEDIRPW